MAGVVKRFTRGLSSFTKPARNATGQRPKPAMNRAGQTRRSFLRQVAAATGATILGARGARAASPIAPEAGELLRRKSFESKGRAPNLRRPVGQKLKRPAVVGALEKSLNQKGTQHASQWASIFADVLGWEPRTSAKYVALFKNDAASMQAALESAANEHVEKSLSLVTLVDEIAVKSKSGNVPTETKITPADVFVTAMLAKGKKEHELSPIYLTGHSEALAREVSRLNLKLGKSGKGIL